MIEGRERDNLELAKATIIYHHEQYGKSPTHFISIPLNLDGKLSDRYSEFVRAARTGCSDPLHDSLLMPPIKLHLTVAVMSLSEPEKLEAAKLLISRHEPILKGVAKVNLKGLHILKGSREACRLLYAKVDEASQAELNNAFAPLLQDLVKAGLCGSLSTKACLPSAPLD